MPLKYSDYVKDNELDQEIKETQSKRKDIPESVVKRFDGKSIEDVLEAYANLEKMSSRQGEDMGRLRKQVDQLIDLQLQSTVSPSEPSGVEDPVEPITVDDLYEDAEGSISKVVQKSTKKSQDRINQLEEQINEISTEKRVQALNTKYDNWLEEIKTEDFAKWATESPYRMRLVQAADKYDFDAADDLLGMWYDHKQIEQKVENKAKRDKELQLATLESASPPGVQVADTFSRSELLEKRIRAKQGDRAAERWLSSNARAITAAYEEGRISD